MDATGYLSHNSRTSHWEVAVEQLLPLNEGGLVGFEPHIEQLAEEMNVAYAVHEFTADVIEEVLRFFETAYDGSPHSP